MEKIKAIITDDDLFTCEQLNEKIRMLLPDVYVTAVCENAIQGAEAIRKYAPQLVFLDIRMPGISGFEMLDHLDQADFEVIFITSYDQYAIQAIRYSALDYLLKPIKDNELIGAFERFMQKREYLSLKARMQTLKQNIENKNTGDFKLIIPTRQGEVNLSVNHILRCEADSNYTHFYLDGGKLFTASRTLKEYEEVLSEHEFIRVHKSHIVNRKYIKAINNEEQVVLQDDTLVEISRRRLAEVKLALGC